MRAFIVTVAEHPGAAAQVFQAVAAAGVNLLGLTGIANGRTGLVALIPDDEAACRTALAGSDQHVTEAELEVVELEDQPGAIARLARTLADSGVNLTLLATVGVDGDRVRIAIGASDHAALERALG